MTSTIFRQLKDIQLQAEKLLSGTPTEDELLLFSRYNEELKSYLLNNIQDAEIRDLILDIPNIIEIKEEVKSNPLIMLILLGIITLGVSALYISYATTLRKIKLIQDNIQIARGKYASIEFLLRAK